MCISLEYISSLLSISSSVNCLFILSVHLKKVYLFLVDSYRIIVDCNICLLITLHILFSRLHLFICGVLSKEVFHRDAVKFINLFICQFLLFVILLKFQKYIFLYAYFFDLQPNQTFFCSAVRLVFDFIISNQKTF